MGNSGEQDNWGTGPYADQHGGPYAPESGRYAAEPHAGGYAPEPYAGGYAPEPYAGQYAQQPAYLPVPEPRSALAEPAAPAGAYARATTEPVTRPDEITLNELLQGMLELGASDLHLTAGSPALVRVHGDLEPLRDCPVLPPDLIQRVLYTILTQKQRERFETDLELDFAYSLPGAARFRVNVYRQRENLGAAFRRIPYEIKTLEDLGVPASIGSFSSLPRGMVLVTGPTGSGKSTTLASLIDQVNRTRRDHIMTVEDPIEFLHRAQERAWSTSARWARTRTLRQRPRARAAPGPRHHPGRRDARPRDDLGRADRRRDRPPRASRPCTRRTPRRRSTASSTSSRRTSSSRSAPSWPVRCRAWSARRCAGRRTAAAGSSRPRSWSTTPAIRNLIREGKTHQIYSAMQAGAQHGMHTLDQHLAELVRTGRISYEHGLEKCHHLEDFNRLCGRG